MEAKWDRNLDEHKNLDKQKSDELKNNGAKPEQPAENTQPTSVEPANAIPHVSARQHHEQSQHYQAAAYPPQNSATSNADSSVPGTPAPTPISSQPSYTSPTQGQQPPQVPIQTSAYQPYLAYGAPPPVPSTMAPQSPLQSYSNYSQQPPPTSGYTNVPSMYNQQQNPPNPQEQPHQYYQPPKMTDNGFTSMAPPTSMPDMGNYMQGQSHAMPPLPPTNFAPTPASGQGPFPPAMPPAVSSPPLTFPMPSLSSLGISDLIPPPPTSVPGVPPTQQQSHPGYSQFPISNEQPTKFYG
ncbi:hypothetical protein DdX_09492 [Ditylenchus destructor]|uniref:Uncharacterized protein n=1 Tax=Ditylenchus destructor TaxID=166010 RepID=A0AAD4R6E0_9BILA|nr:hypothetical protein DdX_09492 [Ditylenchus destructor]